MAKHRSVKTEEEIPRKRMDYLLLVIISMLCIFGIVMVFDSSVSLLSNKYHFIILQSIWVAIGFVCMIVISFYDYHKLAKLSLPLLFLSIILLLLVLAIGKDINGAVRWINAGPFEIQPSELAKPLYVIYLAAWFSKEKPTFHTLSHKARWSFFNELIPFVCLTGFIILLIVIGKDLGTAIIVASTALGMFFVQGSDMLSMFNAIGSIVIFAFGAVLAIVAQPYRLKRLLNFSGSASDPLGSGYQIKQILIAIGSGGLFGKGFTQSIQKQRYLVETTAATDSIFAVIAEEFGFVGSIILFFGYLFLFFRCIRIAIKAEDDLGKLMVMGIVIWVVTQTMLNIAVNVSLVPLTGVPLPFISYGGSSTIILLSAMGIVLNISRYGKQNTDE